MTGFEGVVENLRRAAVACRGACLALRNRYRCDLGAAHAQKVDEVAVRVDDGNVHFPIALLGPGFGGRHTLQSTHATVQVATLITLELSTGPMVIWVSKELV